VERREKMTKGIIAMTAKPGKTQEVIAGVKTLVEYVKSKHNLKGEAYMQIFGGTAGTIVVIAEYNDVASAQAAQAKLMADKEYWAIAQKFAEFIIDPPKMTFLQQI
jgi:hypothetical protein